MDIKLIKGQEVICPDGMGRVVDIIPETTGSFSVIVRQYANNTAVKYRGESVHAVTQHHIVSQPVQNVGEKHQAHCPKLPAFGGCAPAPVNNLPRVIGIAGLAGAGKDTVGDILLHQLPEYKLVSFAEPIKAMCEILGLSHAQLHGHLKEAHDDRFGCTPRHIMQTLGTEWGRNLIHEDIWLTALENRLPEFAIITDVRFQNEADFVRKHGVLINVYGRHGYVGGEHAREGGVAPLASDINIDNSGDLASLVDVVAQVVDKLQGEV